MTGTRLDLTRNATEFAGDPVLPYLLEVARSGVNPHIVRRDTQHGL